MSIKIDRTGLHLPFVAYLFMCWAPALALTGVAQEFQTSRELHLSAELIAPDYQPRVPDRISMVLMDDTKPRLNRMVNNSCETTDCEGTSCRTCQESNQNNTNTSTHRWNSTIVETSFDDMAEGIASQFSNPNLSAVQKANILRSAFETVAQQTRMQSQKKQNLTNGRNKEAGNSMSTNQTVAADMENVHRWLEMLYANQTMHSSQLQRMSLENAALKESLEAMQHKMETATLPAMNRPEPIASETGLRNLPQPFTETPGQWQSIPTTRQTFTSRPYSAERNAIMAWNPNHGYHLKPLQPQATPHKTQTNNVVHADYQMQRDREIEALHQQMEKLTVQIEAFQQRHNRLAPIPDPLQPVYAPEQKLQPLESNYDLRR